MLYAVGLVGSMMIAWRAFGGGDDAQAWIGFVRPGVGVCFGLGVWSVRRFRIERHRAWMLRGLFHVRVRSHCEKRG